MLVIQDPTNEQSPFLLQSLMDALPSAERVVGVFAYASSAGIRLLTEDERFQAVASCFPIEIVVGVDGVTTIRALDSLSAVATRFPNVTVRAFLNPSRGVIFHPKFCWMKTRQAGTVITGSGNLTEGGLLGNWEAYSVENLNAAEMRTVETSWGVWRTLHQDNLRSLDDAEIRARAAANVILAREGDLPTLVAPTVAAAAMGEPSIPQLIPDSAVVLITEIPKSGNRWKQANFHVEDYVNFFGARAGEDRLLIFRHVNEDGSMADYERNRPPVTVKSRNFRFELAAASGIDYPTNGRPIGVFIRVATRTFFYRLLLPDDTEYDTVRAFLVELAGPGQRVDRMMSERTTVEALRVAWPDAPFWNLPPET